MFTCQFFSPGQVVRSCPLATFKSGPTSSALRESAPGFLGFTRSEIEHHVSGFSGLDGIGTEFEAVLWTFAALKGKMAAREKREAFIMLNNWRSWFQSSRVKVSLVRMSASWLWVSTYLTFIFRGPDGCCRPTSPEPLCGCREACLIVGLLPFIIILITASWSLNMYNRGTMVRKICVRSDVSNLSQTTFLRRESFRLRSHFVMFLTL